ncbi:YARHG domain-containing protein [Ekhidna sp. To15]|uniref:YARHG domain-containing protein n=1 Tax=Ekhidna sp. To15 TaxID=3395267 RepID=UPI003F528567
MNKYIFLLNALLIVGCSTSQNGETESNQTEETKGEFQVNEKYTAETAKKLDSAELRIKRNEIFAQYGYKFKSEELSTYFSSKEWYQPKYDNVDSFLTELDKQNITTLFTEEAFRNAQSNFDCADFPNGLSSFSFNSSISSVVDSLGNPNKTFIHEDLTCPIGQLHYWNDNIKNQQLVILGDDYSGTTNYAAKSRYYAIQSLNTSKPSDYSFNGIELGEKEPTLRKKIDCLLSMNPNFELSENSGQSLVEVHYVQDQQKQYVISTSGLYIRFIIASDDRLKCIVFTSFNDHLAC